MSVVSMPVTARRVSTLAVVRMSFQKVAKVVLPNRAGEIFVPGFGRPTLVANQTTAEDLLRYLEQQAKDGPIVIHQGFRWGEPVKPTPIRRDPQAFVDTRPCDSEPPV